MLPDLAVFNQNGQPETVKYHLLPSFLLAGYQRQQKTIAALTEEARQQKRAQTERSRRQERTIEAQAEQIAALERRLSSIEAAVARAGTVAKLSPAVSLVRVTP